MTPNPLVSCWRRLRYSFSFVTKSSWWGGSVEADAADVNADANRNADSDDVKGWWDGWIDAEDADAGADASPGADVDDDAVADVNADAIAGADADSIAGADASAGADVDAEAEAIAGADASAGADVDADAGADSFWEVVCGEFMAVSNTRINRVTSAMRLSCDEITTLAVFNFRSEDTRFFPDFAILWFFSILEIYDIMCQFFFSIQ